MEKASKHGNGLHQLSLRQKRHANWSQHGKSCRNLTRRGCVIQKTPVLLLVDCHVEKCDSIIVHWEKRIIKEEGCYEVELSRCYFVLLVFKNEFFCMSWTQDLCEWKIYKSWKERLCLSWVWAKEYFELICFVPCLLYVWNKCCEIKERNLSWEATYYK